MDGLMTMSVGQWLTSPPLAFTIALALATALSLAGRLLAGQTLARASAMETYASGEIGPRRAVAPGYEPFFMTAIFFTILHLGVLVAATQVSGPLALAYLCGLAAALAILLL